MKYLTSLIVLLAVSIAHFAPISDTKTQFDNEFGAALKQYHAEMQQAILDNYDKFYDTLLSELNGDEEMQRVFLFRKMNIKELKKLVGDSITVDAVKRCKSKINTMLFEMISFLRTKFISSDEQRTKLIKDGLMLCNDKEQAGARIYKEKVQTKWRSMYEKLTAEDLENHAEYKEMNELIEAMPDTHIDLVQNIAQIWLKSAESFGVEEYKDIFKKPQI